jgi:hypothetical protein
MYRLSLFVAFCPAANGILVFLSLCDIDPSHSTANPHNNQLTLHLASLSASDSHESERQVVARIEMKLSMSYLHTTRSTFNLIWKRFLEILYGFIHVAIFWDIAPYNAHVNGRFGGTYYLHLQCRKSNKQETSVCGAGAYAVYLDSTALCPRRWQHS